MTKVFISQPMNGLSNDEIERVRKDAERKATEMYGECEFVDSFFKNAPHDAKPLWFLGKSIELLSTADVAWFCMGWENARGCRIEHACAEEYGLEFVESYSKIEG